MTPLREAPRIMLVNPSSLAKRTLASVNGPNTPRRGFHSTGRTRSCATAATVAIPPIKVRLVIRTPPCGDSILNHQVQLIIAISVVARALVRAASRVYTGHILYKRYRAHREHF